MILLEGFLIVTAAATFRCQHSYEGLRNSAHAGADQVRRGLQPRKREEKAFTSK
jgi:hypothetical protein